MRISDWSSDVGSSVLANAVARQGLVQRTADPPDDRDRPVGEKPRGLSGTDDEEAARLVHVGGDLGEELVVAASDLAGPAQSGTASCRESVWRDVGISGGAVSIKTKK